MIDRRGQLGDFLAGRADARLAVAVREAEQGALVRDIEAAVHEREAVGRVEILDEGRTQFRLPVVIDVTQQRHAITAFDADLAETVDIARHEVRRPELRIMVARAFSAENGRATLRALGYHYVELSVERADLQ